MLHARSQLIAIYSQALGDITHIILCVLLDNDIRSHITIHSKNLSFTEMILDTIKKEIRVHKEQSILYIEKKKKH